MRIQGTYPIAAEPGEIWETMLEPQVLLATIPACAKAERVNDTAYQLTIVPRLGPLSATFNVELSLIDIQLPESYRMRAKGNGILGFAQGEASVRFEPSQDKTVIHYDAGGSADGKIVRFGAKLLSGTAQSMLDGFFQTLERELMQRRANRS
jgi:carbon monoxide dehydrogenase subunit G